MNWLHIYLTELFRLTQELAPWLLLGFLMAGILEVYFPKSTIIHYLGRQNWRSVFNAVVFGIPLPLCSCGVVPTAISLKKQGASNGATVGFLIATPQTGVDSIMATQAMLGLPFALLRVLIAFLSGIVGGIATNWLAPQGNNDGELMIPNHNQTTVQQSTSTNATVDALPQNDCPPCDKPPANSSSIRRVLHYGFVTLLNDIILWLVIGLFLAALIGVLLPDEFLKGLRHQPGLEMLAVLFIAIPLYVCATGSIPIAAALLAKGLSPGAAIVFLMAGPATNVATVLILNQVLGKKVTKIYLVSIIGLAILAGWMVNHLNTFMPHGILTISHLHYHHQTIESQWIFQISAYILIGLMAYSLWQTHLRSLITGLQSIFNHRSHLKEPQTMTNTAKPTVIQIKVYGMTCSHCKANVEKTILKLDGVHCATVDLPSQTLTVEGNTPLTAIQSAITAIGYTVEEAKGSA